MQSASSIGSLPVILGLSLLSLLGLFILVRGLYPRRTGTTPFCRKCNYNLTGTDRDAEDARCPECGTRLGSTETIVIGARVRSWRRVVVGSLVFLLGTVTLTTIAIDAARGIDWYQHKPTAWVIRDIRSSNLPQAQKAWREIQRRNAIGPLSRRHQTELIEVCLEEQKLPAERTGLSVELLDKLGAHYVTGELSEKQTRQMFENAIQIEFNVRPTVIRGHDCPYRVNTRERVPRQLIVRRKMVATHLDGEVLRTGRGSSSSTGWSDFGSFGSRIRLADVAAGTHDVSVQCEISAFLNLDNSREDEPLWQQTEQRTATFELLEDPRPNHIRLVSSAELDEAILSSVAGHDLQVSIDASDGLREAYTHIEFGPGLPIGLAFDVLVESEGRTLGRGTVAQSGGNRIGAANSFSIQITDDVPVSVEIRLVASSAAAMDTVDLFEIWDGELLFEDVKTTPCDGGFGWSSDDPTSKPKLIRGAKHAKLEDAPTPTTSNRDDRKAP